MQVTDFELRHNSIYFAFHSKEKSFEIGSRFQFNCCLFQLIEKINKYGA